jgi:anti-anti-sigma factor
MSLLICPALLEVRLTGGRAVAVVVPPHLDAADLEHLGEQLSGLIASLGRRSLHLDLGNVCSVDGSGLAKLVALDRQVRDQGGHLALLNASAPVYDLLHTAKLDIRRRAVA